MHPYWRSTDLLEYSRSVGIHLSAYSPLGSQVPEHEDLVKDPVVSKIAKELGKTPGQVGLRQSGRGWRHLKVSESDRHHVSMLNWLR